MPRTTRNQPEPSRRDSWPPTQISLYHSIEADDADADTKMDVGHRDSLIDDDPMNSFLTPTPLLDDGDTDDEMDLDLEMDMAFDAGIEDPQRPSPAIRSISPSKLGGGLRPPPPRTPTPPHLRSGSRSPPSRNSPEVSTPNTDMSTDDYDDGEDYVRFTPQGFGLAGSPLSLRSLMPHGKARKASKSAAVAAAKAREKEQDRVALAMVRGGYTPPAAAAFDEGDTYLAPSPSIHAGRPKMAPATRGRSTTSFGRPTPPRLPNRPRSWSGANGYGNGRLSPRAWREPSPDVWSIEEDVEGEVLSEMEVDTPDSLRGQSKGKGKGKRVRFALPVREEIP